MKTARAWLALTIITVALGAMALGAAPAPAADPVKIGLVAAIADRGYVLERGRVVAEGPAAALLTDAALLDAYLGGARPKEAPTS
jgi:hypothetical protein